jgi:heme oxygenase
MIALRAATSACHRRLERRLNIRERFSSRELYRHHLEGMFGFQAPLEACLAERDFGGVLADFGIRRKSTQLISDLRTLGASMDHIASLPRCARLPDCSSDEAALGAWYVFEGATLGGQTLLPVIAGRLGVTAQDGARYLASYGADVALMWQRFSQTVEARCDSAPRRTAAAAAAVATFEALEHWLCECLS